MKYFLLFIILSALFFNPFLPALASVDTTDVQTSLKVETGIAPLCNQDGICQPSAGETESNCFTDCGCNNNGICEAFRIENVGNCPSDCFAAVILISELPPPLIINLSISQITLTSAIILWETNETAFCQLFWGKTPEYEEESISEDTFEFEHTTKLSELSAETVYHFKISCKDINHNVAETKDQKFITLAPPDITPPSNVSNFAAVANDGQITLSWENPLDSDFAFVKIVRSFTFYPSFPEERFIIYTGRGNSFEDSDLINGVRYYYTAFSYDKSGNYSSGAIVSAVPEIPIVIPSKPPIVLPIPPPPSPIQPDEWPIWEPDTPVPAELEELSLTDFDFWQAGNKISVIEGENIQVIEKELLTISIDYEKVAGVFKTIIVSLEKDKEHLSFFLKINRGKTRYSAVLMPPALGVHVIKFYILGFRNQVLKIISGNLEINRVRVAPLLEKELVWYKQIKAICWILLLLILILILIYILIKRRQDKRKK